MWKFLSFTCASQLGQAACVYLSALVWDMGVRGVCRLRWADWGWWLPLGRNCCCGRCLLHGCTRTVFQRIRCQIGACMAEKGQQPSLCCPFLCSAIRAYRSLMKAEWLHTNLSTSLRWLPAVVRKGRDVAVDVARPHSQLTCPSRCCKNILCWI